MMTASHRLFETNPALRVVLDYPGASTKYVRHNWNCPLDKAPGHQHDLDVSPECAGHNCGYMMPLVMETSYVGCVISTHERNGYDDSDFYAVVWDEATQSSKTIEYASTRGWSYPNGAVVDATPEVLEKYRLHRIETIFKGKTQDDVENSQTPGPGKVCRAFKGRKIKKGTVVTVIRTEVRQWNQWAPKETHALVKFDAGNGVQTQNWTNVENLEVVDPSLYITAPEVLHKEAEDCVNSGCKWISPKLGEILAKRGVGSVGCYI